MVRGILGSVNSVAVLAIAGLGMLPMPEVVEAQDNDTITWAGCGITRVSFMQELADGYSAKTGMKFNIEGGGATPSGARRVGTLDRVRREPRAGQGAGRFAHRSGTIG